MWQDWEENQETNKKTSTKKFARVLLGSFAVLVFLLILLILIDYGKKTQQTGKNYQKIATPSSILLSTPTPSYRQKAEDLLEEQKNFAFPAIKWEIFVTPHPTVF